MALDCTTLCLLAISVGLRASNDTKKCSYCMDVRALSPECDAEPLRCAFTDPSSLVYCLTVVEQPREPTAPIRRALRCVSHATFNLTRAEFRAAAQMRECAFDAMRDCDCPNCRPHAEERDYGSLVTTTTMTTKSTTTANITTTTSAMLLRSLKVHRISNATLRLANMSRSAVANRQVLEVKSLPNGTSQYASTVPYLRYFVLFLLYILPK